MDMYELSILRPIVKHLLQNSKILPIWLYSSKHHMNTDVFKTRAILSKDSLKRSAKQSNIKTIEITLKETTRVRFEYVWSQYGNCLQ